MPVDSLRGRRVGGFADRSSLRPVNREQGAHLHVLTIALALQSAIMFTLAGHNDTTHQHTRWCIAEIVIQSTVVLVGSWVARRYLIGPNALLIPPLLVMTALLSLVCEPIQRSLFGTGHSLEVLLMHAQCNLMLALATCGFRRSYRQLCAVLSVFLAIFCMSRSVTGLVVILFSLYVATATVWLVLSHWSRISGRFITGNARSFPLGLLAALLVGPVLATICTAYGASATDRLKGFMPASGGIHDHDEHAFGGVRDGSDLVAGQDNIQSFGPIEDAPFAEDDKPSLYDVFDDTFDDPSKARKARRIDRAIALPPELMAETQRRLARSRQAGRQFSTLRRADKGKTEAIRDLNSQAMFYVAGRTPLHLRLQTFDVFDGLDWIPTEEIPLRNRLGIAGSGGRHWVGLSGHPIAADRNSHRETHAVKIVNLKGNVIPAPPQTEAVSIDLVDRVDMFTAFGNGLMGMQRENLPELTPIHLRSSRVSANHLDSGYGISWAPRSRELNTSVPVHTDMEAIAELAEEWTRHLPRGRKAVAAIVDRLRSDYELDRSAHAKEDSDFPVGDFLLRTRRGPEYLFATAATVLLRSAGYPTRLVGGFYANPARFDANKRHTPVYAADAHFWCEIHVGSDLWMTVEPSPGYEILEPPPGFLARLGALLKAGITLVRRHAELSLFTVFVCCAAIWYRRRLRDLAGTLVWKIRRTSEDREFVLRTLRLIEARYRLVGMPRPAGSTFGNWITGQAPPETRYKLKRFSRLANSAAFGSAEFRPEHRSLCQELERELTFGRIYRRTNRKQKSP